MARALACTALWLAACAGGSSSSDGGADAGLSSLETCQELSLARCNVLQRCYPAFTRETPDQCQPFQQARCLDEYASLQTSFASGAASIDSERVLGCVTRMNTSLCPPTFPPGFLGSVHPFADCEWTTGLARGNVDGGGLCARGIECASGTTCVQVNGACRGTCAALAALSQPCGAGCADGLYCDDHGTADPSDDTCAAPKAAGAACTSSAQCQADLSCFGTCRARGQLGDGCAEDPQRLSTCAPGLACDLTPFTGQTGTCVLPSPRDGRCRFHWSCVLGLVCSNLNFAGFPATAPAPGVCEPPTSAAGPCSFSAYSGLVGSDCQQGTACGTDSHCDPIPSKGEACVPTSQACAGVNVFCKPSGFGNSGTCAGPAALGERCAFRIDAQTVVQIPCVSGYCEAQNTFTCLAASGATGEICTLDGQCASGRCTVQQDRTQRCAPTCPP